MGVAKGLSDEEKTWIAGQIGRTLGSPVDHAVLTIDPKEGRPPAQYAGLVRRFLEKRFHLAMYIVQIRPTNIKIARIA